MIQPGQYRLRNGNTATVQRIISVDALDAETLKPCKVRHAEGFDSQHNLMAWDADTGEHSYGGHVLPGCNALDIVIV